MLESFSPAERKNEESEGATEKLEGILTKDELSRPQRYETNFKNHKRKSEGGGRTILQG